MSDYDQNFIPIVLLVQKFLRDLFRKFVISYLLVSSLFRERLSMYCIMLIVTLY